MPLVCEFKDDGRRIFYDRPLTAADPWPGPTAVTSHPVWKWAITAPTQVRADTPVSFEVGAYRYRGPLLIENYDPTTGEVGGLNSVQAADLAPDDMIRNGTAYLEMGYGNDPIFVPSLDEFRGWRALGPITTSGYWVWTRDGYSAEYCRGPNEAVSISGFAMSTEDTQKERHRHSELPEVRTWPADNDSGGIFTVIDLDKAPECRVALAKIPHETSPCGPFVNIPVASSSTAIEWFLYGDRWLYSAGNKLGKYSTKPNVTYEDSYLRCWVLTEIYPQVVKGLTQLAQRIGG